MSPSTIRPGQIWKRISDDVEIIIFHENYNFGGIAIDDWAWKPLHAGGSSRVCSEFTLRSRYWMVAETLEEYTAQYGAPAPSMVQKREGRVDKGDIPAIAEASRLTAEQVYAVLWAAADHGYMLVRGPVADAKSVLDEVQR